MPELATNAYGKSDIRLTKVTRHATQHQLFEYTVSVQLTGDFAACYLAGDNSRIVPTDTMKNTVYGLARETAFDSPEAFAEVLANHFLREFSQVDSVSIRVGQSGWQRIEVDGHLHPHAFFNAGKQQRIVTWRATRNQPSCIQGGVWGLEVLKTTASGFSGFVKDRFTTLPETDDRIFATSIDGSWQFARPPASYNATYQQILAIVLQTFAQHHSLSVQQTLFAIGSAILLQVPEIDEVSLSLPNQHRLLVDLQAIGRDNPNQIFVATSEPYGLIQGTIRRGVNDSQARN